MANVSTVLAGRDGHLSQGMANVSTVFAGSDGHLSQGMANVSIEELRGDMLPPVHQQQDISADGKSLPNHFQSCYFVLKQKVI